MSPPAKWKDVFSSNYHEPAHNVYCIAFTPRSGSTWLGDILSKSGLLGDPKEYFNQEAARYSINQSACRNVRDYYRYVKTVRQSAGVFGFEAAFQHLTKLIDEGYEDILDDVGTWFLLRRRDYVAQAVSLYRATHSGIFHSYQKVEPVPETPYDGDKIARFALGAMASEYDLSKLFIRKGIAAREFWYEELVNMEVEEIIEVFSRDLELPSSRSSTQKNPGIKTNLEKVSDAHSERLIDRFKAENPKFIEFWDRGRGRKTVPEFMMMHPSYVKKESIMRIDKAVSSPTVD